MLFHLFNYIFLKLFPFIVFFNILPFIVLISSCLSSNTCISTWLNDNKITCGICEKSVANDHQVIHCHKCGIWIHIKCYKINKQTYIYLICENCHWYRMLCTKTFLSYSVLNNIGNQSLENKSNLLLQENQQSLMLKTSLKPLILKTILPNTFVEGVCFYWNNPNGLQKHWYRMHI